MPKRKSRGLDLADAEVREEILIRQRRDMWTPEQIASLAKHFRLQPGMSMLDAGCGYAYSLRTFGPYCMPGGQLVGVDKDEALLDAAARLSKADALETSTFRVADIHDLPFDRDTFDVVMVQVVMCHLDDPEHALDEVIRVTKRGGCVAIFDNAVGWCDWGWDSTYRPTVQQQTRQCEREFLRKRGRKTLGRGDWAVGLYMPGWMEARGLNDVDARVNERVHWIAPPYRSPSQQGTLRDTRERCREDGFREMDRKNMVDELDAAGADEQMIQSALRSARRREKNFQQAVADGHAAYSFAGSFWCIWGFKP